MRWVMRFAWDSGAETFDLELPPQLWRESMRSVGGHGRAGSGAAAGYVARRDFLIAIPLRMRASEWPRMLDLLAWAHTGASFEWTPDLNYPLDVYDVTLDSPLPGEDVAPEPDTVYPLVRILPIRLRHNLDEPFALDYFAEP